MGHDMKGFQMYHGILSPVARFTFTKLTAVKHHSSVQRYFCVCVERKGDSGVGQKEKVKAKKRK